MESSSRGYRVHWNRARKPNSDENVKIHFADCTSIGQNDFYDPDNHQGGYLPVEGVYATFAQAQAAAIQQANVIGTGHKTCGRCNPH